jgi:ferric-dicitrate binding protein FerR (iron transport regulator)
MKLPDRKETEVRGLLEAGPSEPVPPDLADRAMLRGLRLAQRRRAVQVALWVFFAAAVAFAVWAALAEPWMEEPAQTTPPLGW